VQGGGAGHGEAPLAESVLMPLRVMRTALAVPPWFGTACMLLGIAGLLADALLMFASVWLLAMRPGAVGAFCMASAVGVLLRLAWIATLVGGLSLVGVALISGKVLGLVILMCLLAVVATGDKEAFQLKPAVVPEPGDGSVD
jgi:hypothetical protein